MNKVKHLCRVYFSRPVKETALVMTKEEHEQQQQQESTEMNKATAEVTSGLSVFDEQEVDYVTLDRCLSKLMVMMDQPWPGKEKVPAVKLNREHVEFLVRLVLMVARIYFYVTFVDEGSSFNKSRG